MKRLLLIAALASALTLVACHYAGQRGQDITVFKTEQQAPVLETPAAPVVVPRPVTNPPVRRAPTQRTHTPLPKPKPHRPVLRLPPPVEDTLPPQQGTICIFPFNMVPTCTPGAFQ
jgi:hypothetical protein